MSAESPEVLDTRRLDRSILAARLLVIFFIILPLLPFVYVALTSAQIAASPDQGEMLFEGVRTVIYGAIVISCMLLPLVALAGLRLTISKRAITQQPERGRTFLGAMVVWLMYAFLTLALYLLWFVAPNTAP
jgi:uncharacterized membrane protein YozB (DUF420 family)